MVTVFAILLIVIYGSQLIISVINRIAPEEKAPAAKDDTPLDVLRAAVSQITAGKGKIVKVTKI